MPCAVGALDAVTGRCLTPENRAQCSGQLFPLLVLQLSTPAAPASPTCPRKTS
jgi:hypothetical protein